MPGPMAPTGLIKQVKRAACGFRNKQNSGSGYVALHPEQHQDASETRRRARSKLKSERGRLPVTIIQEYEASH